MDFDVNLASKTLFECSPKSATSSELIKDEQNKVEFVWDYKEK